MPKYKFILTLPNKVEIDSAEEIEGHVSWPNWSQADPVYYQGIFDSYDEAEKYASEFEIYKYIIDDMYYDSFECEEYGGYYISIFDAEDKGSPGTFVPGDSFIHGVSRSTVFRSL